MDTRIIYAAFMDSKGSQAIYEIELINEFDKISKTTETTDQILSTFKFIKK